MPDTRTQMLRTGLDMLWASGLYRGFKRSWQGRGVIFTLHHIRPAPVSAPEEKFHPNRILEISPDFLAASIDQIRKAGLEIVSLEEAIRRLANPNRKPFAAFTIDDGYRDNIDHALPVFENRDCPFTVFVTAKIVEGTCELWWLALERLIAGRDQIECNLDGKAHSFDISGVSGKHKAYAEIYKQCRAMNQQSQRQFIRDLADKYLFDLDALCRQQAMTWEDVRRLHAHPLATIGAHTVNHYELSYLSESEVQAEMTESRAWIADETGAQPDFFCYPYGGPEAAGTREFRIAEQAGFAAAVTTRKGMLFDGHKDHLMALPRVSLNGDYQDAKYLDLYLSGAPFALWNKFQRLNVH